jgi:hypothetical protein
MLPTKQVSHWLTREHIVSGGEETIQLYLTMLKNDIHSLNSLPRHENNTQLLREMVSLNRLKTTISRRDFVVWGHFSHKFQKYYGGLYMESIKELSTAQLQSIRDIIINGVSAQASINEVAELREMVAEYKEADRRRVVLASIGEDLDDDYNYWLSFSPTHFDHTVSMFRRIIAQGSLNQHFNRTPNIFNGNN